MLNIFAVKIQEFRNFLTCMLKVKNSIWFIYAYGRGRVVLNQWNDSALALIVQTLDSNIHWIKHYPVDKCKENLLRFLLDRDLSSGWRYSPFQQLGPDD